MSVKLRQLLKSVSPQAKVAAPALSDTPTLPKPPVPTKTNGNGHNGNGHSNGNGEKKVPPSLSTLGIKGWKHSQDSREGVNAIHFTHLKHGVLSILHNRNTNEFEVKHKGRYAGLGGNKGSYLNRKDAVLHAIAYMRSMDGKTSPAFAPGSSTPPSKLRRSESVQDHEALKKAKAKFKKKLVNEVLEKPYKSKAQQRWAHTETGKKALGGEAKVKEWDKKSKGKKLPEVSKSKSPNKRSKGAAKLLESVKATRGWKKNSKIEQNYIYTRPLARKLKSDFKAFVDNVLKPAQQKGEADPQLWTQAKPFLTQLEGEPGFKIDFPKAMMHIANLEFNRNPQAFKPILNTSGDKLSKDGIAAWSLPAVKTCPGAGECTNICYADAGQRVFWDKLVNLAINYSAIKHPSFVNEMDAMVKDLQTYKKDNKEWHKNLRIHDYGDFFSPEYAKKIIEIASKNPQTNFYAYTKSYSLDPIRDILFQAHDTMPNFTVRQSVGSRNNAKLDPSRPMAIITEANSPQMENGTAAGWINGTESDLPATDRKNHIVLLEAHGGKAGKHSLDAHLENAPEPIQKIGHTLRGIKKSELNTGFDLSNEVDQPDFYRHYQHAIKAGFNSHIRNRLKAKKAA